MMIRLIQQMMDQRDQHQKLHKLQVKSAFSNYSKDMKQQHGYLFNNVTNNEFYKRNQQRKAMMMQNAIKHNQAFLDQIIKYINYTEQEESTYVPKQITTHNNRSKIKTTVKQFFREWCSESKQKDDYRKMVEKCSRYLKKGDLILVPGCGLGRLVFDLVMGGFGAQGNQLTYFMLFGSNFIINCTQSKDEFTIYPFIHSSAYYYNEEDIFRSVTIPQFCPGQEITGEPQFYITGGQFTFVYNQRQNHYDGIASCFFLDTANNVFQYVDTVCKALKDDGIWVNFGPLLFHYKEIMNQVSIEISWETLRAYILQKFDFEEEQFEKTTYCHDPKSDLTVEYNCISFVARKKKANAQAIIAVHNECNN